MSRYLLFHITIICITFLIKCNLNYIHYVHETRTADNWQVKINSIQKTSHANKIITSNVSGNLHYSDINFLNRSARQVDTISQVSLQTSLLVPIYYISEIIPYGELFSLFCDDDIAIGNATTRSFPSSINSICFNFCRSSEEVFLRTTLGWVSLAFYIACKSDIWSLFDTIKKDIACSRRWFCTEIL